MREPYEMSPTAQLDFIFPWNDWCAKEGDNIATYTVSLSPGLIKVSDVKVGNDITVWVRMDSQPSLSTVRHVTCSIVTDSTPPRKDTRSWPIKTVNR